MAGREPVAVAVLLLDVCASAGARIDVLHAGVPYWTVANSWGSLWGAIIPPLQQPRHFVTACRRERLLQDQARAERLQIRGRSAGRHAEYLMKSAR